MAEDRMIEQRIISGKGVLRIPASEKKLRYLRLYLDVIREPRNLYANFQWNPKQAFYCRLVFRKDGYALGVAEMRFNREQYNYVLDEPGQTLIAVKCAYEGVLQSFVNLVGGLGGTPGGIGIFVTSVENTIKDFQTLQLSWNEVLFSCYADTAIQARLFGCDYDFCTAEPTPPKDPPPPPPPRPPVPPGTPIGDISPGYDGNDDGNTSPYQDDSPIDPSEPSGEECVAYHVVIGVRSDGFGDPTPGFRSFEFDLYAPISLDLRDGNSLYWIARGGYPGMGCLPEPTEDLIVTLGSYTIDSYEITEFTEITP